MRAVSRGVIVWNRLKDEYSGVSKHFESNIWCFIFDEFSTWLNENSTKSSSVFYEVYHLSLPTYIRFQFLDGIHSVSGVN